MKLQHNLIAKATGRKSIDSSHVGATEEYCDLLLEANSRINLVSRAGDSAAEVERQVVLSLSVLSRVKDDTTLRWLDIGSGGGFPAIPMAIFRPNDSFELIESITKKAYFLERVTEALGLKNVRVRNCRAEEFLTPNGSSNHYDGLSIKAVAGWKEAFAWGNAALCDGGMLVTFKPLATGLEESGLSAAQPLKLIETFGIKNILPEVTTKIMLFEKSS